MSRQRAIDSHDAYSGRFQGDGKVVPGSPEEDAALAQIDHLRNKDVERERAKHNRKLWPHLGRRERLPASSIRVKRSEAQGHSAFAFAERAQRQTPSVPSA